jgi:lipopolysaccharide transport system permease protein
LATIDTAEVPRSATFAIPANGMPAVRIRPLGQLPRLDWNELWSWRGLFVFLVWRDIKARYAQTVFGVGWSILNPLLTVAVFTVIFGSFARIPSDGSPYIVFAFTGLMPFLYFSNALNTASLSVIGNASIYNKVYFPRLILPVVPIVVGLVDLFLMFGVLFILLYAYGIAPSPAALVMVPVASLIMITVAIGLGCWLAALNVKYRDVGVLISFLVRIGMYASPVIYPMSLVPEEWRGVYMLNPLVGIIETVRATLLVETSIPWPALGISCAMAGFFLTTGILYFRRTEGIFSDIG